MYRRKPALNLSHVTPDMTPMIDMVFILLIFVLVAASFVKVAEVQINLPKSSHSPTIKQKPVIVEITNQGTYILNKKTEDLNTLIKKLSLIHDRQILVAADKSSQTQHLIDFIDHCNAANITNLKVAVTRDG